MRVHMHVGIDAPQAYQCMLSTMRSAAPWHYCPPEVPISAEVQSIPQSADKHVLRSTYVYVTLST